MLADRSEWIAHKWPGGNYIFNDTISIKGLMDASVFYLRPPEKAITGHNRNKRNTSSRVDELFHFSYFSGNDETGTHGGQSQRVSNDISNNASIFSTVHIGAFLLCCYGDIVAGHRGHSKEILKVSHPRHPGKCCWFLDLRPSSNLCGCEWKYQKKWVSLQKSPC